MYMPSIFYISVFDNFDYWMDFSFPSFNQRLYGASSSQLMKTDVKETDKDYEVSIDLPGFKKDELQIELKDGYLTVSGSKEVTSKDMPEENQKDATTAEADASKKDAKAEQKTVKYIRQERYSGNVSRSFYVGENLEEKDIHAKFENGTLTLTFPKELEKKAVEEKKDEPRKAMGFISVSIGNGVGEIFRELGVDYLIEGGQTMNPSTEDMLNAIEKVNADVIYILPNNKNIILAAEQAKSLVEDKKIFVVPSKTVPQGIAALINFLPDLSPEENLENMTSEMGRIHTGQITYAVRNTNIDGMEIHEGDIMGIGDSGMLAVGQNVNETVLETLKRMVEDESELISVYFGKDVTEEDAEALVEKVQTAFPNCEVELNDGGQPIYYYLLSVE